MSSVMGDFDYFLVPTAVNPLFTVVRQLRSKMDVNVIFARTEKEKMRFIAHIGFR
jgi:hypothetical protein